MVFRTLFFDLDDTLYPSQNGLWSAIRERMNRYMLERLGIPEEQVPALRRRYFETYGTTLRGLQTHYNVDAHDFLAYVHDLPVDRMVQPDPALGELLNSIALPKHIFTNADRPHALRVLAALGVNACFEQIIDVHALQYQCKPDPAAYRIALGLAGQHNPQDCVYLDDSPRNLAPARRQGFYTILVGEEQANGSACQAIASIHHLRQALPELWQS
jgi:putative hydrolase of the HAD superfamily